MKACLSLVALLPFLWDDSWQKVSLYSRPNRIIMNGNVEPNIADDDRRQVQNQAKVIEIDPRPERRLKEAPGPQPVIAPIQFPGILNPDIYIQNTQSAPVFPHLHAPPVHLNLHLKGLDKYYDAKPKIIHQVHHYNFQKDSLHQLVGE